jgi:hypothetical protein
MNSGIHPIILLTAVAAVLATIAITVACLVRNRGVKALMIVLALVFLLPAAYIPIAVFRPELVDSRFRVYKKFYKDLQVGMTREQVLAAMDQRYPISGPRNRPTIMEDTPTRLVFFMNPETSREPNCEGIFLTLENNRVTKVEYAAD